MSLIFSTYNVSNEKHLNDKIASLYLLFPFLTGGGMKDGMKNG